MRAGEGAGEGGTPQCHWVLGGRVEGSCEGAPAGWGIREREGEGRDSSQWGG